MYSVIFVFTFVYTTVSVETFGFLYSPEPNPDANPRKKQTPDNGSLVKPNPKHLDKETPNKKQVLNKK